MSLSHGTSSFKSTGGVRRVFGALRYSAAGLRSAVRHEAAFRQELALAIIMVPAAFFLGRSLIETALLVLSVIAVLVVELINSAVEALADAITLDRHPLIGRAKDLGSAAVMLTLLATGGLWLSVAISRFLL